MRRPWSFPEVRRATAQLAHAEGERPPTDKEWNTFLYLFGLRVRDSFVVHDLEVEAADAWEDIKERIRPIFLGEMADELGLAPLEGGFGARRPPVGVGEGRPVRSIDPPEHWKVRSKDFLKKCRWLQEGLWEAWGLARPLGLEETEPYIRARLAREVRQGEQALLTYPIGEAGRIVALRSAEIWMNAPEGLALLAQVAAELSWATGCAQWQAVGFLLCDLPYYRPWLSAEVVPSSFVNLQGIIAESKIGPQELPALGVKDSSVLIEVGSLFVPAEAVRNLYVEIRDRLLGQEPPDGRTVGAAALGASDARGLKDTAAVSRPRRPRGQRARTLQLLAWVDEGRAKGLSWPALFEGWAENEGAFAYANTVSMQRSYYQARKRRKALEY